MGIEAEYDRQRLGRGRLTDIGEHELGHVNDLNEHCEDLASDNLLAITDRCVVDPIRNQRSEMDNMVVHEGVFSGHSTAPRPEPGTD